MQIYKPGGDYKTAGVDDFGALMRLQAPDPSNASIFNADVTAETRQAGPVDDHSIFNNGVEFGHMGALLLGRTKRRL